MADNSKPVVSLSLDDFLQNSPIGPIQTAIGNNFYGINHRQLASPIPINKDNYGYTFFVRPQLNMQKSNLRNMRRMTPLLTGDSNSLPRIIRCLLDPRQMYGYPVKSGNPDIPDDSPTLECPFVDNRQAFIPILTNHLKSISGWPDINVPTYTSNPGAYEEAHSMVDGIIENYTAYDIQATFRNSKGDPIMAMFLAWLIYQSAVFTGDLVPYPDFLVRNELDYNTRIYRLVMDPTKTKVQKIAACGAAVVTSLPIGGSFDFSTEKPYNDANSDITINFKCNGAQYQDDILIDEFNKTVRMFNPSMDDRAYSNGAGSPITRDMVKIPNAMLNLFNNRGYPRINPNSYDLEWYIYKDDLAKKEKAYENLLTTITQ